MGYKNKQDALEYERKWQKENREKTRQYAKTYREKNRDKQTEAQRKWREQNKDYRKKYYEEHKDRELQLSSAYRKATPEQQAIYRKRHYEKNHEVILEKKREDYDTAERMERHYKRHEYFKDMNKKNYHRKRSICVWHYSRGTYSCNCCGFNEGKIFMDIDHINGGGNKHRKAENFSSIIDWLIRNNLPEGFQVLCANCNQGKKRNNNICPHQAQTA